MSSQETPFRDKVPRLARYRIGIDLGGTKIEGVVLGPEGDVCDQRRVDTPRGDYPETIGAIVSLVGALETRAGGPATVGIGTPGVISPVTGVMKNANSTWLNGKPLEKDLTEALGRPIRLANDANCFTLSEAVDGAAAGARVVFGVIVGTGTGGGIVVDGKLLVGPNAVAGEWGHNPLPWPRPEELPGPVCYCHRHGCIETFLSGPGLERDHHQVCGERLSSEEIATRAGQGEARARATLDRYVDRMARALASVINMLDPDIIVFGGGLSKVSELYDAVPRRWGDYVFSDRVNTKLVPPCHGDAGGVRGAAWLWPPRTSKQGAGS